MGIVSNNEYKKNRVLFDFESIVDLKLSYIVSHNDIGTDDMEELKFRRMYDNSDALAQLLKDVDEEEYIHPKHPVFTGMRTLCDHYQNDSNGLIHPKVLCKDEFQQRIIKESIPNVITVLGPRKNVKTIRFSRIVLADPKHALEFNNPVTVDFMVLNFRDNFSKNDPTLIDENIIFEVCDVNQFTIANAYPEIPDPVG